MECFTVNFDLQTILIFLFFFSTIFFLYSSAVFHFYNFPALQQQVMAGIHYRPLPTL